MVLGIARNVRDCFQNFHGLSKRKRKMKKLHWITLDDTPKSGEIHHHKERPNVNKINCRKKSEFPQN